MFKQIIIIVSLLFTLAACSPPQESQNSSAYEEELASITVTIPGLKNTANKSNTAQRVGVPSEVSSLIIAVLDSDANVLDAAEVIGTEGSVTLSIEAGENYTIRGSAYAGSELLFRGEAVIAELKIGSQTSVALTLDDQVLLSLTTLADMEVGVAQSTVNFNLAGLNNLQINWYVNGVLGGNSSIGLISTQGLYTPPSVVPTNASIEITAEPLVAPSFAQSFTFQLLVSTALISDAGSDQVINENNLVTLDGSNSQDSDNVITTFLWQEISSGGVVLNDTSAQQPTFNAPEVTANTQFEFQLTVTNDDGEQASDTVFVTVNHVDKPLVSHAGSDQVVDENTLVTLDGAASNDPDNVITTYLWEELSSGGIVLNNASSQQPTFTAPDIATSTVFTFRLTVTNDNGDSEIDTVDITVNEVLASNNKVYFAAREDFGDLNLWVTDGTNAGTQEVAAVRFDNYSFEEYKTIGDYLYFQGNTTADGRELWRTDGTLLGTEFFASADDSDYVNVGAPAGAEPIAFSILGDKLLYRGVISSVNNSNKIARYLAFDSVNEIVTQVSSSSVSSQKANNVATFNGESYYYENTFGPTVTTLYKTDGTNLATAVISMNSYGTMKDFTEVNGELYFIFDDNALWKTDGTTIGTVELRVFTGLVGTSEGNFTGVNTMISFNNNLYFVADDGINGRELWVSDGTSVGTVLLLDLDGTAASTSPSEFHIINGQLVFLSSEGGASTDGVWVSDGTALGTSRISNTLVNGDVSYYSGNETGRAKFVSSLNVLFFTGNDGVNGSELWVTDGTALGTKMVKNMSTVGSSNPSIFRSANGFMVFGAKDDDGHAKLWRTDGTNAGTSLIKDINAGGFENAVFFPLSA